MHLGLPQGSNHYISHCSHVDSKSATTVVSNGPSDSQEKELLHYSRHDTIRILLKEKLSKTDLYLVHPNKVFKNSIP